MSRKILHKLGVLMVIVSLLVSPAAAFGADSAQTISPWAAWTSYAVGALASYNGTNYQALQAHTSQPGWEPPNVPALWKVYTGGVATNTPTRTPTRTNTPAGPTATFTRTPTRTNTPVGPTATPTRTPTRTNTPVGPTNTPTRTPTRTNTPVAPTATPTATTRGGGSCWAAWVAATAYSTGAQVSRNGQNYQAAFWSQGSDPATNSGPVGSGLPWTPMGACSGGPTNTPTRTNTPAGPTATFTPTSIGGGGGNKILGYFAQWDVYTRNYHVKNIHTSGSAAKLTHINYAFGNVTNGQCVIGDAEADYSKFYDAAASVDGVSDTWDTGALRGNFNQLKKLKLMYPNLKILWSFGGWTWSGGFAQAAQNPTAFANSCYALVHDPRWNGLFDGIDIDWEYPNACGLTCDTSGPQAYASLMSALRTRFGNELVTAAVPAGYTQINAINYGQASQYVDWYNVMTYDFFGAFDTDGPTAPHSPLNNYSGIPQANYYSDYAIQLYKQQGVPASKLLIGIGFYGRGWTGVGSANGGLGQSATGPATGSYEAGIEDYKVLVNTCPSTGVVAGTSYAYCNGNWWSYDTPANIADKMAYKRSQGLGGAFFWELSGDTSSGTLITAMYNNR